MPISIAASDARFPTTQWTVILSLNDVDSSKAQANAMRELCKSYWFPLYAFARHRKLQRADAEDAVQSFFVSIGDADFFQKADQDRGKLRTFILTAFTRMLHDQRAQGQALKRGGGQLHLSIDGDQAESWLLADPSPNHVDSALVFERHWAKQIMRSVIQRMRATNGSGKHAMRFEILSRFLSPETCMNYSIREAATDLEMQPAACEKAIQRLRHQFRQAIHEELAMTLNQPNDITIGEEMIQLQKALLASV